jgi:hypothetical protein
MAEKTTRRLKLCSATALAAALIALDFGSAFARPVRTPTDRDHRGTAPKPLPNYVGTSGNAVIVHDHRSPAAGGPPVSQHK